MFMPMHSNVHRAKPHQTGSYPLITLELLTKQIQLQIMEIICVDVLEIYICDGIWKIMHTPAIFCFYCAFKSS